jgi:hypothetical protein
MYYTIVDMIDHKNGTVSVIIENPFGPGTVSFGFTYEEMNNNSWKDKLENILLQWEEERKKPIDLNSIKENFKGKTFKAGKKESVEIVAKPA